MVLPRHSDGSYGKYLLILNPQKSYYIIMISGNFHSSDTEITPHWTLRGFDQNGIARVTYHVFPWGTNARSGFPNGGRYWAGKRLRASQCHRI